jgi:phosphinothricin acetyltransferase
MSDITIRKVSVNDAKELLDIYSYYVKNTAITFEYEVPSIEEFSCRIRDITKRYPYLAAEMNGRMIGFAYAHEFIARKAYDWSAEVTIYVDHREKKHGIGRFLYSELEKYLRAMGVIDLYACIGVPNGGADEYLDFNSFDFHKHMGYELRGTFPKSGYKFTRWYDMVWLGKTIGEHLDIQPDITVFDNIQEVADHGTDK